MEPELDIGPPVRLVPTKIRPPALGEGLAPRARIGELIDSAARLTAVIAPAGYGKTVAVAQWASGRSEPVAWLTIDEQDRPAGRFWQYVAAAFSRAAPEIGDETIGAISEWAVDGTDMASVLLAELGDDSPPMILVLDDVHHITEPAIIDQLAFFLERTPEWLRIVVVSRTDLRLPSARWQAEGLATEIRQGVLNMVPREALQMIRAMPNLGLDSSTEERLIEITGGWPVALQLAALSLRGRPDADRFVRDDLADDRLLFDYVVGEVLGQLSADDRQAVLALSVLDDIDRQRCEQLTGSTAGDVLLLRLVRLGLPIVSLAGNRRTYRFHALFRDLVRLELQLQDSTFLRELHRRAAVAERVGGDDPAAVRHLLAAGDHLKAFAIAFEPVWDMYRSGATRQLTSWLDQFPPEIVGRDPQRIITFATALGLVGRLDDAARWNAQATSLINLGEPLWNDLTVSSMVVDLGRGDTASIRSRVAGLGSTPNQLMVRDGQAIRVSMIMAIAGLVDGDIDEAERWLGAFIGRATPPERVTAVGFPTRQAWLALEQGKLDEACRIAESSLEHIGPDGRGATNAIIELFVVKAHIAVERFELDDADSWADRAIELAAILGAPLYTYLARGAALNALEARSGPSVALSVALQVTPRDMPDAMRPRYRRLVAELAARAGRWADCELHTGNLPSSSDRQLLEARIAIGRGQLTKAVQLIDAVATSTWPLRRQIEVELLQHRCRPGETVHLQRALELGVGRGLVASYLREDEFITSGLRRLVEANPRWRTSPLAAMLNTRQATTLSDKFVLIEALSAKEREVLRLLPSHLSTVEIAQLLFVSANTVRTHIKAIYRKLDVGSRTDAVRRAAALGLTTTADSPI